MLAWTNFIDHTLIVTTRHRLWTFHTLPTRVSKNMLLFFSPKNRLCLLTQHVLWYNEPTKLFSELYTHTPNPGHFNIWSDRFQRPRPMQSTAWLNMYGMDLKQINFWPMHNSKSPDFHHQSWPTFLIFIRPSPYKTPYPIQKVIKWSCMNSKKATYSM